MIVSENYYSSDEDLPESSNRLSTRKNNEANSLQLVSADTATRGLHSQSLTTPYYSSYSFSATTQATLGPENPLRKESATSRNHLSGNVEPFAMDSFNFEIQRKTYINYGYAMDPTSGESKIVGDIEKYKETHGADMYDRVQKPKKKRLSRGDPGDPNNFHGPWAGFEGERVGISAAPTEAEKTAAAMRKALVTQVNYNLSEPGAERSIFHGKDEIDSQGKTYMSPPVDVDVNFNEESVSSENFLPKRLSGTLYDLLIFRTGHTKAVSKVLFLPRTGHLVLSASMDGRAKIWDTYHKNVALRTFIGHNKGIKDVSFNVDGSRFLTGSYDKYIKLWDTETGKCVQSYALSTVPNCLSFNPEPGNQHIFLAGCADNKIRQYDINAGVVTRDYSNHDGAVNCVTFLADHKHFVSSSDDKSLRIWEFGSPHVIKYIYEEEFFSMPSVILHPNGKRMVCQSLDDQILVFSAQDRYKKHRKKFLGHQISGFSCQIISSPDGQFLMSGDASGNAWFWDWNNARILRKFKAHDMILNSCAWHPIEPSKIATCSWDSTIKIWE